MIARRLVIRSTRGAYVALVVLTAIWGSNWIAMKLALERASPGLYNLHRVWLAIAVLLAVLVWRRRKLLPELWLAVVLTGFFQTTLNMGATVMALAEGGVGRTSVLVFTMPFWTMLIAWPVLGERLRGVQWIALGLALAGLALVVEPWNWEGQLRPKLWAVLSGFGWASGTVTMRYFQRKHEFDMLNFICWQMIAGILPLSFIPAVYGGSGANWDWVYVAMLFWTGAVSTAGGFLIWVAVLRYLPASTASLNMLAIPVIALISSMLIFGERLAGNEWLGIGCIAAGLAMVSLRAWMASRRGERVPPEPMPLEGG